MDSWIYPCIQDTWIVGCLKLFTIRILRYLDILTFLVSGYFDSQKWLDIHVFGYPIIRIPHLYIQGILYCNGFFDKSAKLGRQIEVTWGKEAVKYRKQKFIQFFSSWFRCSTFVLVFGCWLMNHVIYLKLRQNQFCYKLSKWTRYFESKWSDLKEIFILSENNCHFVIFFRFQQELFLSQLEICHVIHEPVAKN